jgi:hypothetical protein
MWREEHKSNFLVFRSYLPPLRCFLRVSSSRSTSTFRRRRYHIYSFVFFCFWLVPRVCILMLLINLMQVRILLCYRRLQIAVIFSGYLSVDTRNTWRRTRIFWSLDVCIMVFTWRVFCGYEIALHRVARTENAGCFVAWLLCLHID